MPDRKSLHLQTFHPNRRKRSHAVLSSRDSVEDDPE